MSTLVERFAGVCVYKSSGPKFSFARIYPLSIVKFEDSRRLEPLSSDQALSRFPKEGLIFWQLQQCDSIELDMVYEFGIEEHPKYHGSSETNKDWYQVKTSDDIFSFDAELIDLSDFSGFDEFREQMQFICEWKCDGKIYFKFDEFVYGPYNVKECKGNEKGYNVSVYPFHEESFRKFAFEKFANNCIVLPITYHRRCEFNQQKLAISRKILDKEPSPDTGELCEPLPIREQILAVFEIIPEVKAKFSSELRKEIAEAVSIATKTALKEPLYLSRLKTFENRWEQIKSILPKQDSLLKKYLSNNEVRSAFGEVIQQSVIELCKSEYEAERKKLSEKLEAEQHQIEKKLNDQIYVKEQHFQILKKEIQKAEKQLEELKAEDEAYLGKIDKSKQLIEAYKQAAVEVTQKITQARSQLVQELITFQSFLEAKEHDNRDRFKQETDEAQVLTFPPPPEDVLESELDFIQRWYSLAVHNRLIESEDWATIWIWHIASKAFSTFVVPGPEWTACWLEAFGNSISTLTSIVEAGWTDSSDLFRAISCLSNDLEVDDCSLITLRKLLNENNWQFGAIQIMDINRSLPELYLLPVIKSIRHTGLWADSRNKIGELKKGVFSISQHPWLRWVLTKCTGPHAHQLSHEFWQYAGNIPAKPPFLQLLDDVKLSADSKVGKGIVTRNTWQSWIREPDEEIVSLVRDSMSDFAKQIREYGRFIPANLVADICRFVANARGIFSQQDSLRLAVLLRSNHLMSSKTNHENTAE